LVVGASNAFNQIIEREHDKRMLRTENRPLADGRMKLNDAAIFATVCALFGLITLSLLVNYTAAFLGLLAIMSYTLAYTPLKRITPLAVFVGAIPGAIPPMIGWVAISGYIDEIAISFFMIQFFWQFPHFWAIAWMYHDDYSKAGYFLLPSRSGRSKSNALQTVWYTVILMMVSMYPLTLDFGGWPTIVAVLLAGGLMMYRSLMLVKTLAPKEARKLLFSSFLYMPAVLISFML
jgi:protoheme IX farnesyltransferase